MGRPSYKISIETEHLEQKVLEECDRRQVKHLENWRAQAPITDLSLFLAAGLLSLSPFSFLFLSKVNEQVESEKDLSPLHRF